jgi:SagB-type dehydrogenase family enzyme
VEVLHRSTTHGEPPLAPERLVDFRPLDESNRPAPFKAYTGVDPVPLARGLRPSSLPATEVLSGRRGEPEPLDEPLLGTLLFLSAGVTRVARTIDGEPVWFRASMSAGNLHPVEVYVVDDDVHHYAPLEHALSPLRRGVGASTGAAVGLVLTGIPFRTCWKYGERGWRHLWWDAGTLLANLLAVADAHGVPAEVGTGFDDAAVAELVGVDGVDEVPLAVIRLGAGEIRVPPAGTLPPVAATAAPVARRVLRFPLVAEAHAATALGTGDVDRWRAEAASLAAPSTAVVDPPLGADPEDRVELAIGRRGSTRLFRPEPAPLTLLQWALPAATRVVPFDLASPDTLVEHLVNVQAVDAAEAGGYRYTASGGFEPRTSVDDARRAGRRLCLDQPLGGDAAYTVFHAAALDPLLGAWGGRAYRVAQLEAGVVAGRLAMNAVALGAGATGLTFYDGLVSRYFRTTAAPLLATAVGLPATAPAPTGTPGRPAELRGYGDVMARLAARLRGQ